MLRQIKKITNIGQFYATNANGDITFQKVNLIYGLNGYGKSTLTDIFRSLSNGECSLLESKASVGKSGSSECAIAFLDESTGKEKVYAFKGGSWTETNPKIKIFDARFVSENVYSDFDISHQHKERLTTLILGDAGTKIAEDIRGIQKKIEDQKKIQRSVRESISRILPAKYIGGVDGFIKIAEAEKSKMGTKGEIEAKIKATKDSAKVKALGVPVETNLTTSLETLLPSIESYFNLTELGENKITEDVVNSIENHISEHLDQRGEDWLKQGLKYHTANVCPFCTQDTDKASIVIDSYKLYFSKAYSELVELITSELSKAERTVGGYKEFLDRAEGVLAKNTNTLQEAKDYLDPSEFTALSAKLKSAGEGVINEANTVKGLLNVLVPKLKEKIEEKRQRPLSKVTIVFNRLEIIDAERKLLGALVVYNKEVKDLGVKINALKVSGATDDVFKLEKDLAEISAIEQRFSVGGAKYCEELVGADTAMATLELEKTKQDEALVAHNSNVAKTYLKKVNELLKSFRCRFSIMTPDAMNKKGHAPVIDVGFTLLGKDFDSKKFGHLLSESDKRALAFAFFIAQLHSDPTELKDTIVVIDDPFTSLDDNRVSATCFQIKALEPVVKQIIILSHYSAPISVLASDFPDALQLVIENDATNGSDIGKAGLERLRHNDHEKRLERLEFVQSNTIDDSEIPEVKRTIRQALEHEMGMRFRHCLKGVDATTLGKKIDAIEKCSIAGTVNFKTDATSVIAELRHVNKHVSGEHHADGTTAPYVDNVENLRGLIDMALELIYSKL